MKTIFYSKDAQFELTEEEYKLALLSWDKGQRCFISRLNVSLSPLYLWAGDKPEDHNRKKTKDGQWCIKKYGQWYLESDQNIKIDLNYYSELQDKTVEKPKEIASSYGKELADKI